jgi:hypothetical protein
MKEYTVPSVIVGLEASLKEAQDAVRTAQARVSAVSNLLSELKEVCGVDGCVGRYWSEDRMKEHREEEHPNFL